MADGDGYEEFYPERTPVEQYILSYAGEQRGGVVKDVAFNRRSFETEDIRNPADNGTIQVGTDGIRVELVQDFDDGELQKFFSWAINATRGIDPENPPDNVDWEEMMKGGLQTALKRINIAFGVFGVSRTATHQIVRSTRANFHQQSQRAHYYGLRPEVRMPESWLKSNRASAAFVRLAELAAETYNIACEEDISYQDARFALLEGTDNFILCEYSLDEFIAVYSYRGCSMFQWEIVSIMREMRRVLIESHPWLEPYIKISCERTKGALDRPGDLHFSDPMEAGSHHCTFQGWEEVDEQCDFPWARESNRSFRSERHGIKKKES